MLYFKIDQKYNIAEFSLHKDGIDYYFSVHTSSWKFLALKKLILDKNEKDKILGDVKGIRETKWESEFIIYAFHIPAEDNNFWIKTRRNPNLEEMRLRALANSLLEDVHERKINCSIT